MSRFMYVLYGIAIIAIFTFANIEAANDDDNYNSRGRGGSFSGGHK